MYKSSLINKASDLLENIELMKQIVSLNISIEEFEGSDEMLDQGDNWKHEEIQQEVLQMLGVAEEVIKGIRDSIKKEHAGYTDEYSQKLYKSLVKHNMTCEEFLMSHKRSLSIVYRLVREIS